MFQSCLQGGSSSREGLVFPSQWFFLLLSKNPASLSPKECFALREDGDSGGPGPRQSPLGLWVSNFPIPSRAGATGECLM